jgi:hypothetical protein
MRRAGFTYGLLDERLRALGFTVRTQQGKARIYRHEPTGASVILPDVPFDEEVLPHHLAVARHALKEHNLGDVDQEQIILNQTHKQYPPGAENLKILVEDLIRDYKKAHPDEAEDLEVFPPRWYGSSEDGMLRVGRSIFVIRDNHVEQEIKEAETPPAHWL